jgi:hypothetical protein
VRCVGTILPSSLKPLDIVGAVGAPSFNDTLPLPCTIMGSAILLTGAFFWNLNTVLCMDYTTEDLCTAVCNNTKDKLK